jgi:hypothetical protein
VPAHDQLPGRRIVQRGNRSLHRGADGVHSTDVVRRLRLDGRSRCRLKPRRPRLDSWYQTQVFDRAYVRDRNGERLLSGGRDQSTRGPTTCSSTRRATSRPRTAGSAGGVLPAVGRRHGRTDTGVPRGYTHDVPDTTAGSTFTISLDAPPSSSLVGLPAVEFDRGPLPLTIASCTRGRLTMRTRARRTRATCPWAASTHRATPAPSAAAPRDPAIWRKRPRALRPRVPPTFSSPTAPRAATETPARPTKRVNPACAPAVCRS